jgi:hypothetical protein
MIVTLAGACGAGGNDASLSADASARLRPLVREVRLDVESYDPAAAADSLQELRTTTISLRRTGSISDAQAATVLAAAADVETNLADAPTTTTTTTTPPTTTPAAPKPGKGPGPGHGDDKGKDGKG